MAVSAGTEIKRSHLSDILDDVLAEMVSRALITQAQANAMTVDAQTPGGGRQPDIRTVWQDQYRAEYARG